MEKAFGSLVLVLILVLGLTVAAGWANDRAADAAWARGQAEAAVIRAETEANVRVLYAALPWGVLGALSILGLSIVALAGAIVWRQRPRPHIISREIVYLPPPGQRRLQTWQIITGRGEMITLPAETERD